MLYYFFDDYWKMYIYLISLETKQQKNLLQIYYKTKLFVLSHVCNLRAKVVIKERIDYFIKRLSEEKS